jgi:hypothetical protein
MIKLIMIMIAGVCVAGPTAIVSVRDGEILPAGYVSSVSNLVDSVAITQAGLATAVATAAAANLISNELAVIRELEEARNATGYIRGFVESFSAGIVADTNLTASIVAFESGGVTATNALWDLYTFFTEDPGNFPAVTTSDSAGRTNEWALATSVDVILTNKLVGATDYECYLNRVTMPLSSTQAFFRVRADVAGIGTNTTYFPVTGGIAVNGNNGVSITVTEGTNTMQWIGGVRVQ